MARKPAWTRGLNLQSKAPVQVIRDGRWVDFDMRAPMARYHCPLCGWRSNQVVTKNPIHAESQYKRIAQRHLFKCPKQEEWSGRYA